MKIKTREYYSMVREIDRLTERENELLERLEEKSRVVRSQDTILNSLRDMYEKFKQYLG